MGEFDFVNIIENNYVDLTRSIYNLLFKNGAQLKL